MRRNIPRLALILLLSCGAPKNVIRFAHDVPKLSCGDEALAVSAGGLEQWCENQFNMVRATAFPHAYFEKDNESVKDEGDAKGTQGD